jgi:hypothetical protein
LFAVGQLDARIDLHGRGKIKPRAQAQDSFLLFPTQPIIEDERVVEVIGCPHAVIGHPQSGEARVHLVANHAAWRLIVGEGCADRRDNGRSQKTYDGEPLAMTCDLIHGFLPLD